MKDFLIKNKDGITTALGAVPAVVTAGYSSYEMVQGTGGNGTTIALAMIMALVSWFTGKH